MNGITITQDSDGHWYWIPDYMLGKFKEDLSKIEDKEYMDCPDEFDLFIEDFDKYRTGGSPDLKPDFFQNDTTIL
jgi:hypothetical protein